MVKDPPANSGDVGLIPGEGNGNSFQYSCQKNPMDRRAWWDTVHGVTKQLGTTMTKQQVSSLGHRRLLMGCRKTFKNI